MVIMNSPRGTLIIGLLAVALGLGQILFNSDGASSTVIGMQYFFLALGAVAVIGALVQMGKKK